MPLISKNCHICATNSPLINPIVPKIAENRSYRKFEFIVKSLTKPTYWININTIEDNIDMPETVGMIQNMQKEIHGCCYKTSDDRCMLGISDLDFELGIVPPTCWETRKENSCGFQ